MRISSARTTGALGAVIALAVVGLWSSVAAAGPLGTSGLAINSDGPDGGYWRGSVAFHQDFFGSEVEGTFDWAVFAPGDFQAYLDDVGIAAADPAPGQVMYAYQVSGVSIANPGIGSVTVGMDATDVLSVGPTQVLTSWAGEQAMTSAYRSASNTSAVWEFATTGDNSAFIAAGEISPLLVFASPNAPEFGTFSVSSGLAGYNGNNVGSPGSEPFVPEPCSFALVMIGIAGLLLARRNAQ